MAVADVVVVSYNSAGTLRAAVEPLAADGDVNVVVVDNASADHSTGTVADLGVTVLALTENHGFAYGCNRGWREGSAPTVLFLNPDARIGPDSLRLLVSALDADPTVGIVAPAISDEHGSPEFSLRRFPRLRSTFARAFFLHRVWPNASWTDEVVRDADAYRQAGDVEWVSGACMLVRRSLLDRLGGWDEGFFLYGEDVDLCRRAWDAGYRVRFEPSAHASHVGGVSAPRAQLLSLLAANRVRYARIHEGRVTAALERLGVAVGELTHAALSTKGATYRRGHLDAFKLLLSGDSSAASRSASGDSVPTAVETEPPDG
jgi:N-acetylglucosaminyl-diphospho-decaprenol L-rhamnosyltransferase